MINTSVESELLLYLCNPNFTSESEVKIKELLKQNIDWLKIINLAKQHGVTCLVYQQITNLNQELIPINILNFFRESYLINLKKNIKFTGELLRIVKLFESNNISVISFKGSVLAELAYHNLGMREFEDLDLLILETQIILADSLLKKEGYLPQFPLTNQQLDIYVKIRSEFIYYHPQKEITIDLHWRLLPKYFSFSDNAEFSWQNQQQILLNNHKITTLNKEIYLLFLCSHGAKHDWLYLCWISDLVAFIKQNPNLDWDYILKQVDHIASKEMLFLGLFLANNLFNITLPEMIIKQIKEDNTVLELAGIIKTKLFEKQDFKEGYITPKIYLKTMLKLSDKIWFWFDTIFTPTPLELTIIDLPRFLFPIYYIIRLCRLILKYVLKFKPTLK